MISTVLALRTTAYLKEERAYMPWESAISNLDFFYLMFDRSEVYGPLQVRVCGLSWRLRGPSVTAPFLSRPPSRVTSGSRSNRCLSTTKT